MMNEFRSKAIIDLAAITRREFSKEHRERKSKQKPAKSEEPPPLMFDL